jgi:hypothetical protein
VTIGLGSKYVLWRQNYTQPGTYLAHVELKRPQYATLHVTMRNEHGQFYHDAYSVSYNVRRVEKGGDKGEG